MFKFVPKLSKLEKAPEKKEFFKSFKEIFSNKQMNYLIIISMMKSLVTNSSCILFIQAFISPVFADLEPIKVMSLHYDDSSALVYITTKDNIQNRPESQLKYIKLSNPNRIYFDINNELLKVKRFTKEYCSNILKCSKSSDGSVYG